MCCDQSFVRVACGLSGWAGGRIAIRLPFGGRAKAIESSIFRPLKRHHWGCPCQFERARERYGILCDARAAAADGDTPTRSRRGALIYRSAGEQLPIARRMVEIRGSCRPGASKRAQQSSSERATAERGHGRAA